MSMNTPHEATNPHEDPEHIAQEILERHPEFTEAPTIEVDENIPPRPEEDVADVARSAPDFSGDPVG